MPTRDPKQWMWAEACELLDRAERIHRQFFQLAASQAAWEPPVDVYETAEHFVILIALPGVPPDQIQVGVEEGGALVVSGQRQLPAEAREAAIYRLEIPNGAFRRRIELPVGRFRLDQQQVSNGCLVLRLRKLP